MISVIITVSAVHDSMGSHFDDTFVYNVDSKVTKRNKLPYLELWHGRKSSGA